MSSRSNGLTKEEIEAMKERITEQRAGKQNGEADLFAKIDAMPEPDRGMAKRVHAIIKAAAPGLTPRTWYGMPAYSKSDSVICWFQPASKFKTRYITLGFSDKAHLDEGNMWPTVFAITKLSKAEETKITSLVKKAVS